MQKLLKRFFDGVGMAVYRQLPLFLMVVSYSILPALFDESPVSIGQLLFLLRQVILPAVILCVLGNYKKWIWWIIFTVINLLFFIELGCFISQHIRLNSVIAILILQSNKVEATEFLSSDYENILKAIVGGVILVLSLVFINAYWGKLSNKIAERSKSKLFNMFVLLAGFVLSLSVIYSPLTIYRCLDGYKEYFSRIHNNMTNASTFVSYYYILADTFFDDKINKLQTLAETNMTTEVNDDSVKEDLKIVYIIGESFGRLHSNLYGYPKETNPHITKEIENGSAFMYDNIISNSNYTHEVVPFMLSLCDIDSSDEFMAHPLLPAVFKKGGFRVGYYDNQSLIGDSKHFDFGCTYFFSNPDVRESSIDEYNNKTFRYDSEMVSDYPPELSSGNNLIIYHFSGQHVDFFGRFPKEFSYFTAHDYSNVSEYTNSQAQVVAAYDNATLYQDFTVFGIFELLRDKNAIVVFVPDHGEEVYDYRDHTGRDIAMSLENIKVFYEVPVFIWVSDKFKSQYPEDVEMLRGNRSKALFNSDLVHTLIDIAGLSTPTLNRDLSLLQKGRGRDRRMIRDIDYDSNRERIFNSKMRFEQESNIDLVQ